MRALDPPLRSSQCPLPSPYPRLHPQIWARDSLPANPLVTHETGVHGMAMHLQHWTCACWAPARCFQGVCTCTGRSPTPASAGMLHSTCANTALPYQPSTPDVAHLRDPAFLVRALRYRSARLLHTLAARLRKHSRRLGEFKVSVGGRGGGRCTWCKACVTVLRWLPAWEPPALPHSLLAAGVEQVPAARAGALGDLTRMQCWGALSTETAASSACTRHLPQSFLFPHD